MELRCGLRRLSSMVLDGVKHDIGASVDDGKQRDEEYDSSQAT